jgi:hypothetical protein
MKKYLLFSYMTYYPAGGMDDLYDSYDSFEEAFTEAKRCINVVGNDCFQIVDKDTLQILAKGEHIEEIE